MPKNQDLSNLEEYLSWLQTIELKIADTKGMPDLAIVKAAKKPQFYTGAITQGEDMALRQLQGELEEWLLDLTKHSGSKGKLMSQKAMEKFLDKSERRDATQKSLRQINQFNGRQIERRIRLYKLQLERQSNILRSEIEEFFLNSRISGRGKAETLKELIKAAGDNQGIVEGFKKRVKRISVDASRREAQEQATSEYLKLAKPSEEWQWITISSTPCPDCQARAGKTLPYRDWIRLGLPGAGRTICLWACKCQLVPVSVSDELFPDAKSFKWDREKQVLTTASEARSLNSKKARK